jgi:hypothetical protein
VQSHYIFDPAGHLIAEHDGATNAVVREYVWLGDEPIAMIDSSTGTAQTYFIHAGQIGEPLVMTDSAKAKVWDAYVEPYGMAQVFGTPSAGQDDRGRRRSAVSARTGSRGALPGVETPNSRAAPGLCFRLQGHSFFRSPLASLSLEPLPVWLVAHRPRHKLRVLCFKAKLDRLEDDGDADSRAATHGRSHRRQKYFGGGKFTLRHHRDDTHVGEEWPLR